MIDIDSKSRLAATLIRRHMPGVAPPQVTTCIRTRLNALIALSDGAGPEGCGSLPRQGSIHNKLRGPVRNEAMSNPIAYSEVPRPATGARTNYGRRLTHTMTVFSSLIFVLATARSGFSAPESPNTLDVGKRIYVRLVMIISTRSSHLNQPVTARVVRDITNDQRVLIPIGAEVTGKITKIVPPATPSDHARLMIKFTKLNIPRHPTIAITAHVTEVENARETVLPDGTIQGILEKNAAAGRVDGLLDKFGSAGDQMSKVSSKTLGKVDTAVEYPAGTDLALTLDEPLTVDSPSPPTAATQISPAVAAAVQRLLSEAPQRVQSKSKKPGDPLNLIVVGNSAQILAAFKQAGWSEAVKLGTKSAVGTVRAMASNNGYENAPVSQLYLYGRSEDVAFEKALNTFLKRHHLRLWETTVKAPGGRSIWIGAATHDIGLDVHFRVVSHEVDPDLDLERAKVGADLMASGLVAAERLVARPNPLTEGKTATGGTWRTDGELLVIELRTSSAL